MGHFSEINGTCIPLLIDLSEVKMVTYLLPALQSPNNVSMSPSSLFQCKEKYDNLSFLGIKGSSREKRKKKTVLEKEVQLSNSYSLSEKWLLKSRTSGIH